jgi:hypothetical protein
VEGQLSRLFHQAADAAGIKKAVTLHALRHSFARGKPTSATTSSASAMPTTVSPTCAARGLSRKRPKLIDHRNVPIQNN